MNGSPDDVLKVAFRQAYTVCRDKPFLIFTNTVLFLVAVIICVVTVVGLFVMPAIVGGYVESMLRVVRGEDQAIGRFFRAGFVDGQWWRLLCISVLYFIGLVVGFVLLVIPGVYLTIVWTFVFVYAVDKKTGVIESFSLSRRLVHAESNFSLVALVTIVAFIAYAVVARIRPLFFLWPFLATPYIMLFTCSLYVQFIGSPTRLIGKSSN